MTDSVHDDLATIEDDIWNDLLLAVTDSRHEWHLPVLGTSGSTGPQLRTVVLRDVNRETRSLVCHTDRRAEKVIEIEKDPEVCWLFYSWEARVQLRMTGTAKLHTDDSIADARWTASRLESRRCYLAPLTPGEVVSPGFVNLPEELRERPPTFEEVESGRRHFAVISCEIHRIEWLFLHWTGNRRAEFNYSGRRVVRNWLAG